MNTRVKELTGGIPVDVNSVCCPSRGILEHVTSRWAVLVLAVLLDGTHRFSELRRAVGGVSEKMLAQTLQTLEQDGLVHREAYPVIPPRVDYSLTPLGEEAARHVWTLARWAETRTPEVLAARAAHAERPTRDGRAKGGRAEAAGAKGTGTKGAEVKVAAAKGV
ncbi:winged helix-turn-helix transcriptional regulator [Kitasatospora sp. NPDC088783]|uniref:winged helix-turn-helix transcriptional regulator n=1 Tax=Kitasatospora sp. NPDC088783 TaxID=3364077 RepID=UPI0038222638